MGSIAELAVRITADAAAFRKEVAGMGPAMDGAAKAVGVAALALGAGVLAATVDGIKGIIAMEDETAQLDAVLKSTGGAAGMAAGELISMAEALQKTTKFAAEDTVAAENMLLTFTNIGKDVFPQATTTLLDMATAMGTDAKSGAIQLGKALNDPSEGISALTRVGVTFTEEQKKVIAAMQESGDMAGAQKVILAELAKEFGGSAEAAGKTFSGQMAIANNAVGEIYEGLAMRFMPVLFALLEWVNGNMPQIEAAMSAAFDTVGIAVTWISDNVLPVLVAAFTFIAEEVVPRVVTAFNFVKENFDVIGPALAAMALVVIIPALVAWGTAAAAAAATTIAALAPVLAPIAAVGLVVAAVALAWKLWGDDIQRIVGEVVDWVTGTFDAFQETISKLWTDISDGIAGVWTSIAETATSAWDGIKAFFAEWWETLLVVFTGPLGVLILLIAKNWDDIKATATEKWAAIKQFFTDIWEGIKGVFGPPIEELITLVSNTWDTIKKTADEKWTDIKGFFSGIWTDIKSSFTGAFNDMVTSAGNFGRDIMNALKRAIGSVSIPLPSFSLSWKDGPLGVKIPDIGFGVNMRSLASLIPGLEHGGDILRAGLTMVGERGPEILSLPQGARVTPLTGSPAQPGAGTVINVTIAGPVYGVLDFEQRVTQTIRDAIRGGGFRGVIATP